MARFNVIVEFNGVVDAYEVDANDAVHASFEIGKECHECAQIMDVVRLS